MLLTYINYSGFEPTEQMSVLQTVTVFVLIPTAIFAAVTLLWWLAGSHAKAKAAGKSVELVGPVDQQ